MPDQYIAIDLGAESGRVMLGTLSPSAIDLQEIHRFPNTPIALPHSLGQTLHWNILHLWQEIKTALDKIAATENLSSIRSIAVDTWGVNFALLDAHGALLANPVCYRDPRTDGMIEKVFAQIPRDRVYSLTGIQTMSLNTLFQLASLAGSPLLKSARHLLFLPDLISYWLSGHMATEYTIASTSQLLDAQQRTWSPELLSALSIDPSLFPPLIFPGTLRGKLLPSVNEKLARLANHGQGLHVVAVGSHDTASAVAAVPADPAARDWLYLSSGTWSLLGAEVNHPVLSEKAAIHDLTNEGGVDDKIRLLKNIPGLYLLQECRRAWAKQGSPLDYATLTHLAASAPPPLAPFDVTDPSLTAATPDDMPTKITALCLRANQPPPTSPAQFTRLILESLAARYGQVARILDDVTNTPHHTLHIVGGGSRNDLLNQLAANATGMHIIAGPVEATALGNILLQALATKTLPTLAAGRALVRHSPDIKTFKPQLPK